MTIHASSAIPRTKAATPAPSAAGVDTDEVGNEAHPAIPTGASNAVRMPSHHGWMSNRHSLAL